MRPNEANSAPADPRAVRLELLDRFLAERRGWARTESGWALRSYEVVPQARPQLPYRIFKGDWCVGAVMGARLAIALCEQLVAGDATLDRVAAGNGHDHAPVGAPRRISSSSYF